MTYQDKTPKQRQMISKRLTTINRVLILGNQTQKHYIEQLQTGNIRQRKQAIAALCTHSDNRDVATIRLP
jgi:hypothetical protein